MEKAHIHYEALDNGFLLCRSRSSRSAAISWRRCRADFFWRWYWRLPSPFTKENLDAGYVYELAFRQFEVSDTVIFDRPQAGRAWFEAVIRDHLDIGRPDQVALIFQKRISRRTPGPFRTRVITKGVEPILTCYYRSSRLKQYFKEGRGLRTESSSATPATSISGAASAPRTGMPCGPLAKPSTAVCVTPRRGRDAGSRRGLVSARDPTVQDPRRSLCARTPIR
jgi:hypothetical protein